MFENFIRSIHDMILLICRMMQPGIFRDRKSQRAVIGTSSGRNYGAEIRDRSRSPRGGSKPLVPNSSCETGRYFCSLFFLHEINHKYSFFLTSRNVLISNLLKTWAYAKLWSKEHTISSMCFPSVLEPIN